MGAWWFIVRQVRKLRGSHLGLNDIYGKVIGVKESMRLLVSYLNEFHEPSAQLRRRYRGASDSRVKNRCTGI